MSLNRVTLLGNVGKDPDVRYLDSGVAVAQFSLATTVKGYTTQEGKTYPDRTEWHNLVAWGNLALDIAEKRRNYVKGDFMYVEGRLKTRQYVDSQNVNRYVTEVVVDKMMNIGTKRVQNNPEQQNTSYNSYQQSAVGSQQMGNYQQPAVGSQPAMSYQPTESYQQPSYNNPPLPEMPNQEYDDDLPF